MKNRKFLLMLIMVISILTLTSCKKDKAQEYITKRFSYFSYLDTISTVTVQYEKSSISDVQLEHDMKKIDDILLKIEEQFSREQTLYMQINNISESQVMKVNKNSGLKDDDGNLIYTKVDKEFIDLLKAAISVSKLLNGSFDVTVGPLTSLWNISKQAASDKPHEQYKPSDSDIKEKLKLVDYNKILIDEESSSVALEDEKMKLDFGAIAKGYAADKVLEYLQTLNFNLILINLGGNIYSVGENKKGSAPVIGIRNPFYEKDSDPYQIMETKEIDISAVTSGTYERYITVDGVIYHHLLNPKTGYPFENEIISVSIFGTSSMMCDALATGIYGLGLEEGIETVKKLEGYNGVFITKDKKVYIVGDIVFEPEDNTEEFNFINK